MEGEFEVFGESVSFGRPYIVEMAGHPCDRQRAAARHSHGKIVLLPTGEGSSKRATSRFAVGKDTSRSRLTARAVSLANRRVGRQRREETGGIYEKAVYP
jgi:hypothetical protein